MRPLRALFVTYGATSADTGGVSMMGVVKRCARLISQLPPAEVEPHLVHFGTTIDSDPLIHDLLPQIPRHYAAAGNARQQMRRLYCAVNPDVVVLGEGPGGGLMSAASEAAADQGIPQVCVENFYGRFQPGEFVRQAPVIREWLLLGLPDGYPYGRVSNHVVLLPPLLAPVPRRARSEPVALTILGYDMTVARLGVQLLGRLPEGTTARLVCSSSALAKLDGLEATMRTGQLKHAGLPTDSLLREYLSTSSLVVCKSGFQQMIESLAVGTPVIAYGAPGGVPEGWLAPSLRPFVRYFPFDLADWSPVVAAAAVWLARRPRTPWAHAVARLKDPIGLAGAALRRALRRVRADGAPEATREHSDF